MRVLIQSRQRFIREALAVFLAEYAQVEVVGMADLIEDPHIKDATAEAAIVWLESARGSEEAIAALRARQPDIRVIMVLPGGEAGKLPHVTRDADIVVSDDFGGEALLAALGLEAVRALPRIERQSSNTLDRPRLTPREREVLNGIRTGETTQRIAACLGISPDTVDKHKRRAFTKLGVHSQAHAVAVAVRHGLLPPM